MIYLLLINIINFEKKKFKNIKKILIIKKIKKKKNFIFI